MQLQSFTEHKITESLRKSNYKDSYLVYTFAKLLRTDFNKWDAYKLDIIDNQGKVIGDPVTPQQKKAFGDIENIARKVKRALVRYAGKSNTMTNLIALFLLQSEGIAGKHRIKREILDELTNEEIIIIENLLLELKELNLDLG